MHGPKKKNTYLVLDIFTRGGFGGLPRPFLSFVCGASRFDPSSPNFSIFNKGTKRIRLECFNKGSSVSGGDSESFINFLSSVRLLIGGGNAGSGQESSDGKSFHCCLCTWQKKSMSVWTGRRH